MHLQAIKIVRVGSISNTIVIGIIVILTIVSWLIYVKGLK